MIEKLEQVQFQKGNLIIKEGDAAGPMYILEKGRARAFTQNNGAQVNLAFYRDGDFFGELSILNGSPRAASVGDARGAFFNADDAKAVAAFAERLMPGAPGKPGATDAGVLNYIDLALAGAYSD